MSKVLPIICTLLVAATPSLSEEPPRGAEEDVYEMGEIVVTAKRMRPSPNTVIEVTSEEIQSQGARTVSDVLRLIQGVDVRSGSKAESHITLRGFQQREVLVLLDGHPIDDPYEGTVDLEQIPLDNIAKIKVILGPASSLYGANTMGGVVNIVTKRSSKDLRVDLGDRKTIDCTLGYGDKIGKVFYYFTGMLSRSEGYPLPSSFSPTRNEDGGLRENSDYERRKLSGRVGWRFNETSELVFSSAYHWSKKGMPPDAASDSPKFWRFTDWRWWYGSLEWRTKLFQRVDLKGNLFHDVHRNTLVSYKDVTYADREWTSEWDNHSSGGSLLAKLNSGTWGIFTLGTRLENDIANTPERHRGSIISASLQNEFWPSSRLFLQTGIGYDLCERESKTYDYISPQLGAVYSVSNKLSIFASIGRKIRFPTLKELYSGKHGNPDLLPQKAISYEAGVELHYLNDLMKIRASLFRSDVDDLIAYKGPLKPFENINSVYLKGGSIGVSSRPSDQMSACVNYTYLDTKDTEINKPLEHRPKHRMNMSLSYKFKFGLLFHFDGSYVDKRSYYRRGKCGSIIGIRSLSAYTLYNFQVIQTLMRYTQLYLDVRNITDQQYEDTAGYPLPGRTFNAGIQIGL